MGYRKKDEDLTGSVEQSTSSYWSLIFLNSELGTVGTWKCEIETKDRSGKALDLRAWADVPAWPFAVWSWDSFSFSLT